MRSSGPPTPAGRRCGSHKLTQVFGAGNRPRLHLAFPLAVDIVHEVPEVDAAGDQFSARSSHGLEHLLAALIDDRYFGEVHHASPHLVPDTLFPTRFEFSNPRRHQSALQNPALLNRVVGDHDPQHCVFSPRRGKCTCHANAVLTFFSLEALSKVGDMKCGGPISMQRAKAPLPQARPLANYMAATPERDYKSNTTAKAASARSSRRRSFRGFSWTYCCEQFRASAS